MVHTLRTNYAWKDEYIVDKVEERGMRWLQEQFKLCKEGELEEWKIFKLMLPIARTPLSKKAGRAMMNTEKKLDRALVQAITPWKDLHAERRRMMKEKYGIESGEIAIVDTGDGVASALRGDDENIRIVKG